MVAYVVYLAIMCNEKNAHTRRLSKKLPETAQQTLFAEEGPKPGDESTTKEGRVEFVNPSPEKIFVGNESLRVFLENNGLGWVIRLRSLLESSDMTPFVRAYKPMGRRPFHPVMMLGLIVYGVLQRQWSLRELEMLSKRDVGAWWLCGGRHPDHSTLGRFVSKHADVLTEEYFVSLTTMLVKKLKLKVGTVAGDGTVVESAADGYRIIKEDAAKQAAQEARKASDAKPEDAAAKRQADNAEDIANAVEKKTRQLREHGKKTDGIKVSPADPQAVIQKTKKGTFKLAYIPSVLANKERIILGHHLDPSDETACVSPMLNQYQAINGELPSLALFDANYSNQTVLSLSLELDMDILCPSGPADRGKWEKSEKRGGKLGKSAFVFNEEHNYYVCPQGQKLQYIGRDGKRNGQFKYKYQCYSCDDCEMRAQCTDSKKGRIVLRYEVDELKDAMNLVFKSKKARQEYRQRQHMVEPIYSDLKQRQGLDRFHRRGLKMVRAEFSIHCLAHNLKKALQALPAGASMLVMERSKAQIRLFWLCLRPAC